MNEAERAERVVRQELRSMQEEVKGMRGRVVLMEAMLPGVPEEAGEEDIAAHPTGLAALRIELQGLIKDHLGPLLEELVAIENGRKPTE